MKPSILISCSCFARYKSTKEMAQKILLQRGLMVKVDKQDLPKEKHPKEKGPKVEVVMGMEMVLEDMEEMEIGVVMEERVEEMEEMDLIQKVKMKRRKRMRRRKKKKIHIYQQPLLVRRAHQNQNGGPRATLQTISFKKGFFSPPRGFFFLICSVFRPLHLSCHFPSMLHAICGIWELEPFILRVICRILELNLPC